MPRHRASASLVIAMLAVACRGADSTGRSATGPRAPAGDGVAVTARGSTIGDLRTRVTSEHGLDVRVRFDDKGLHVRVAATGPAKELGVWELPSDPIVRLEVRGANDEVAHHAVKGRELAIEDVRGPTVVVQYDVSAPPLRPPGSETEAASTMIEAARFRALGAAILAMPKAFVTPAIDVELDVDGRGTEAPIAASSFAIGKMRAMSSVTASGAALRRAVLLAGPGGLASFDLPEGKDESAWLGYTAFDPRAVAAEIAACRTLLNEYFWKGREPYASTTIFVTDARPRGRFRVARQARGLVVALSGTELYDAPLRLAVSQELVHAWIGDRIWVGSTEPGREPESYWFHEGVARWVAREQLARAGLLAPNDLASEVNRLLAIVTTSPHASRSTTELARESTAKAAPGVVPLLVARGALFATLADARIREISKGTRSYDDVVRTVAAEALEGRGVVAANAPHLAYASLVTEARARADFDEMVEKGTRTRLPDDALGGCFEARDIAYEIRDEGFDVPASLASGVVIALDPKGVSSRAGLRDGDTLVSVDLATPSSKKTRVVVQRAGAHETITFDPTTGTRRGQSFRRKSGLSDDACRKLALRH